jgi:hypothetical protein
MHQLPGCRSAAEAVRELPLRAGLKRCGVAEAGGWVASRCFGWAGFQMLRCAQHDRRAPLPSRRLRGLREFASLEDNFLPPVGEHTPCAQARLLGKIIRLKRADDAADSRLFSLSGLPADA